MTLHAEETDQINETHTNSRGKTTEQLGDIEFELTDFLSDKVKKREFYKYFNGHPKTIPILSWGVKLSVAIVPSYVSEPEEMEPIPCPAINIEKLG